MTPFASQLLAVLQHDEPRTLAELTADFTLYRRHWPENSIPANVGPAVAEAIRELTAYGRVMAVGDAWKWIPEKLAPMPRSLFDA